MYINFPKTGFIVKGAENIAIPPMLKVKQKFNDFKIEDIKAHLNIELDNIIDDKCWYKDKNICITAGSRGIANIDLILKTIVDKLKSWGANPFIIPAMGSHGGSTAEGQKELLATFNITEESMGVKVLSSMDVEKYSSLDEGTPLYIDKYAYHSDGIVVVNRIKPHTDFHGKHESGLLKMIAIGLAKHVGASMFHMKGFNTFAERIPLVCNHFIEKCPVAFGVGIVENAYHKVCNLEVIAKEKMIEKDAELLEIAKKNMPRFKYPHIDVIIIDEIGKNISGTGFDPNIVSHDTLDYKNVFVRGLTRDTNHNANGIGHAEVTTQRMLSDVDWDYTWINNATSTDLEGGKIPMYLNSDREALIFAIRTCNNIDFVNPKIVRIKNTAQMDEIMVSPAYWECIKNYNDIEKIGEFEELKFDNEGYLIEKI